MMVLLLAAFVGGYVCGSVPFGLLLTRAAGLGDIRAIGSGNIGATNVLRTGNKKLAAATLLLDAAKGAAGAWLGWACAGSSGLLLGGAASVVGHCYPVWLRFRGGKGVATAFGVLFAIAWPVALIAGAVWLAVARLARISSLASLSAFVAAPLAALALSTGLTAVATGVIAAVIFLRHDQNIARLYAGTEPRMGRKT
jgi:glycerol-3-phosphate acyltransferase PlsY